MLNLEERVVQARLFNIEEAKAAAATDQKWMITKIDNFITRFGGIFTRKEILDRICDDNIMAAQFAKDPAKQNIYEKSFLLMLQEAGCKVSKLAASGPNSMIVFGGELLTNIKVSGIKTIDFIDNSESEPVYITHKYTKEAGGAQDNQYHDLLKFAEEACKCTNYSFAILADGAYYTESKINTIKEIAGDKVFVGTTEQYLFSC